MVTRKVAAAPYCAAASLGDKTGTPSTCDPHLDWLLSTKASGSMPILRTHCRTLRPRFPAPNSTKRFSQPANNLSKAAVSRSRTLFRGSLSKRSSSARYSSVFVTVIRSPSFADRLHDHVLCELGAIQKRPQIFQGLGKE